MTEVVDSPILLLCDWAEAINGKLYVQGAGFNMILADTAMPLALAVLWNMPWHLTNVRHVVQFRLVTADGQPVADALGNEVQITGNVETGRPPGARHGDSFPVPLAIKLPPFPLPVGDYRWELTIGETFSARASFRAVAQLGPNS